MMSGWAGVSVAVAFVCVEVLEEGGFDGVGGVTWVSLVVKVFVVLASRAELFLRGGIVYEVQVRY